MMHKEETPAEPTQDTYKKGDHKNADAESLAGLGYCV